MKESYSSEDLIIQFLKGKLSPAEEKMLNDWKEADEKNLELFNNLSNKDTLRQKLKTYHEIETEEKERSKAMALERIFPGGRLIHLSKRGVWKRWATAAAVILAVSWGTYLMFFNKNSKPGIVKTALPDTIKTPETNKATITLANGQKVYLDSAGNGTLSLQGNIKLVKLADGEIAYQTSSGNISRQIEYNTLYNPRGSKIISLTLNDGTKVWLNCESSLRYPTAFVGNERKVEITGEAYFEVKKDNARKFFVMGNDVTTEVLGTHFNINAYPDESAMEITLLEGSVKVSSVTGKSKQETVIRPGEQAQVAENIRVIKGANIEEVMAWKNGLFQFNKASLQEVMRQIARWYDVEISYERKISPLQFGGKLQRDLSLDQVLEGLEKSQVHFRIEGRKVIVIP